MWIMETTQSYLKPSATVAAMARELLALRDVVQGFNHDHETALLVRLLKESK